MCIQGPAFEQSYHNYVKVVTRQDGMKWMTDLHMDAVKWDATGSFVCKSPIKQEKAETKVFVYVQGRNATNLIQL